jgi:hypothetical protein
VPTFWGVFGSGFVGSLAAVDRYHESGEVPWKMHWLRTTAKAWSLELSKTQAGARARACSIDTIAYLDVSGTGARKLVCGK